MRSHLWDGDRPVSQYFGGNAAAYAWIKDWRGVSIKGHNGLDVALPNDTPIYAPFDCTCLVSAFDEGGYGNYVCVSWKDTDGVLLVAHLRSRAVHLGQRLVKGTLLGPSDNTGWSTGPHTHIGYRPSTGQRNMDNGYNGYEDPLEPLAGLYEEEDMANQGIIDELSHQVAALETEVASLHGLGTERDGQIVALRTEIGERNSTIGALTVDIIPALEARLVQMEEQVREAMALAGKVTAQRPTRIALHYPDGELGYVPEKESPA